MLYIINVERDLIPSKHFNQNQYPAYQAYDFDCQFIKIFDDLSELFYFVIHYLTSFLYILYHGYIPMSTHILINSISFLTVIISHSHYFSKVLIPEIQKYKSLFKLIRQRFKYCQYIQVSHQ